MIIPPQFTGHRKNLGIVEQLRNLKIGEKTEFPIKARFSLHACAKLIKIKIATRQLGSKDTVTVWRVE